MKKKNLYNPHLSKNKLFSNKDQWVFSSNNKRKKTIIPVSDTGDGFEFEINLTIPTFILIVILIVILAFFLI